MRLPAMNARRMLAAMATLGLVMLGALLQSRAQPPPTPQRAASAPAAAPAFYELRIYTAAPGKLDALHARFRAHTLRLFEKHGIRNVGYWTAVDAEHQGRLYYVIAYPDEASRERMLIEGIAQDPEFLSAVAESERDGKLTQATESVLLRPTDYSPLR